MEQPEHGVSGRESKDMGEVASGEKGSGALAHTHATRHSLPHLSIRPSLPHNLAFYQPMPYACLQTPMTHAIVPVILPFIMPAEGQKHHALSLHEAAMEALIQAKKKKRRAKLKALLRYGPQRAGRAP